MIITAGTVKGKACAIAGTLMVNGGIWDLGGAQRQIGILTGAGGQVINNGSAATLIVGNGGVGERELRRRDRQWHGPDRFSQARCGHDHADRNQHL